MPQDAFTIYHASKELNEKLRGAKVEKINQPEKDAITLSLRTADKKNVTLLISANANGARVCVTSSAKPAPLQAPAFCMLTRKHLARAAVKSVEAVPYERITIITFDCKDELGTPSEKQVIAEIMGKYSNVTLVENGIILGALKTTDFDFNLTRPIFPGAKYVYPLPQDKLNADETEKIRAAFLSYDGELEGFIFNKLKGVSKPTADEIAFRFYEKYNITRDVKNFKIDDFITFYQNFYECNHFTPNVVKDENYSDFFILDYKTAGKNKTYFNDINSAIDYYFSIKEAKAAFSAKKRKLTDVTKSHLKKLEKKLQTFNEKILSASTADELKKNGELIIAYLYKIKPGDEFLIAEDYTKENYPEVKIKLDKNLTPQENAEKLFKRYAKLKKTVVATEPQIKETKEQITYFESILSDIERAETTEDFDDLTEELIVDSLIPAQKQRKNEKKKKSPFRNFYYEGFEISAGRNNVQNDRLVTEAERADIWLHTKNYHSSHVIIRTKGKNVPDNVLLFAAQICAYYSNAKSGDKIPVDYTLRKFVKKPAGAPLGKVYYTEQKTLLVTPDPHTDNEKR